MQQGGGERLTAIAALIRAQQPDAVALLEATQPANVQRIATELGMQVVFGEGNDGYHMAWLTRLPLRASENHRLVTLAKTLLEVEVAWIGSPLALFATHLASRWDGRTPVDEVPSILGMLRSRSGQPHLLVGDFNALRQGDPIGHPPPGVEKRGDARDGAPRQAIGLLLAEGYVDTYRAVHPYDPGYTYPSHAPWLRIDYHFASPELAMHLRRCELVNSQSASHASDHFPLWSEFH